MSEVNNEHLITAFFFRKTLLHLLKENEGMIVTVDDNLKPLYPGQEKVIVFKHDDEIHILNYDGDLNNGEFIDIEIDD